MKVYIILCAVVLHKTQIWKKLVPEVWAKMLLANDIAEFLNQLYFQNNIIK